MNSGPVTAGVLRGQKSRFQLFGDVVNTAARMESTGTPGKIQASQSTVDYLLTAGKSRWVQKREELVEAKGKGTLQTYWIEPSIGGSGVVSASPSIATGTTTDGSFLPGVDILDERTERLVEWNTDILANLIRQIVARRQQMSKAVTTKTATKKKRSARDILGGDDGSSSFTESSTGIALDELQEVIDLPTVNSAENQDGTIIDPQSVELTPVVMSELRDFVVAIASSYLPNPFHSYEHCSHVTMSVVKLLGRIVTKTVDDNGNHSSEQQQYAAVAHPMTQFALVFSAMIHDAGHTGVPNFVLAKENPEIASKYRGQSLAEQRSIDISFELLMAPVYKNLRDCIFGTNHTMGEEFQLFRQLVVNSVIATDIFDPTLSAARKARWEKAFKNPDKKDDNVSMDEMDLNRKATIVIEYVLQVSIYKFLLCY